MLDSISIFRVFKSGLMNFVRNPWLSVGAGMVMTITLVIFSLLFMLFTVTNYSIKSIQNKVDISVYFKNGLSEEKIKAIQVEVEKDPAVKETRYISAAQAFELFKERHKYDPQITQSLNELTENPLPATLNVKANNLEDYTKIAERLQKPEYKDFVEKVNYEDSRDLIDKLTKILKYIVSGGIALVVVFSLIAILVIFNTITLTIYHRKEEVEIMRLVGATNWYIRGPFLVESLLYALSGTFLSAILFVPVFTNVLPKIAVFIDPEIGLFSSNLFNFVFVVLMMLIISCILASLSTFLAIRKYLKI